MDHEIKQVAKEAMKLCCMCDLLSEMNDPDTTRYYDSSDFMQIEIDIRKQKELVITKIKEL